MSPNVQPHRRPKVVAVGDGVAPTGFARVMHSLLRPLSDRWEFHHLAINWAGHPAHGFPWEIYPAAGDGDIYGAAKLRPLVEKVRPDLIFLLNDLWILRDYLHALRDLPRELRPPIVAYTPVDAGPLEPGMAEGVESLDRLVAYTEYGRSEIAGSAAELARRQEATPTRPFPRLDVLPHGVDTDLFAPYDPADDAAGRRRARVELFGADSELLDAFIVLNANRNQPRKRIDLTIEGFARFARDKPPDVRLYLHMGVEDAGWNIVSLAYRHGIQDRLILTAEERFLPAVPDEVLNRIFNACDVGINTSIGEGWGLVSFEHAATGAPQIVPGHGACRELWEGSALLLDAPIPTVEGIAAALEALYRDSDLRHRLSSAAFANATRPDLAWDSIAERWHQLFLSTLNEPAGLRPRNEIVSRGTHRASSQEAR